MRYCYDLYFQSVKTDTPEFRKATSTALSDILKDIIEDMSAFSWRIEVYDNLRGCVCAQLRSQEDIEMWEETLARNTTWIKKPTNMWDPFNKNETGIEVKNAEAPKKDAINPSHYKNYIFDLQWLEAMQYIPSMRDPKNFKAAVELQVRKYLDRLGGKDAELQELSKSLWYMKFLVAYIKNGNKPIRVSDIEAILNE